MPARRARFLPVPCGATSLLQPAAASYPVDETPRFDDTRLPLPGSKRRLSFRASDLCLSRRDLKTDFKTVSLRFVFTNFKTKSSRIREPSIDRPPIAMHPTASAGTSHHIRPSPPSRSSGTRHRFPTGSRAKADGTSFPVAAPDFAQRREFRVFHGDSEPAVRKITRTSSLSGAVDRIPERADFLRRHPVLRIQQYHGVDLARRGGFRGTAGDWHAPE